MNEHVSDPVVLDCSCVVKNYNQGGVVVPVLQGVSLALKAGERVAIVGVSGSGKSTLLHLLGGLDEVSSGYIGLQGQAWSALGQSARGLWRNRYLGFIYQFHHLLPEFSALENVALPLLIRRMPLQEAEAKAIAVLSEVGLSHRLAHLPAALSGGERQRVAVARALVTAPLCVLADEPTGNLDRQTAEQVFEVMLSMSAKRGTAFVIVTHDLALAARADRRLVLQDGVLNEF